MRFLAAAGLGCFFAWGCGDAPAPTDASVDAEPSVAVCGAPLGPCDPTGAAVCPGSSRCYLRTSAARPSSACSAPGAGQWGTSCRNHTDCLPGFGCLPAGPGATDNQCQPLCCPGDDARCSDASRGGRPGAICLPQLTVTGTAVRRCVEPGGCDPYAATGNGCASTQPYCEYLREGVAACTPLLGPRAGGDGHVCCVDGCLPGYRCVATSEGACDPTRPNTWCRRLCNPVATSNACTASQRCTGLTGRPPSLGACLPR
ncbi:MAG: hypothetical protein HY909_02370 [Deltaproteobacteria bacterium]|nr:hypothetical protein [Deltaproteobacteria bacterium]